MCIIITLLLQVATHPNTTDTITIDTDAAKTINLSEVTNSLNSVPLSETGFALGPIKDVYFINDKLYVLECKTPEEFFYARVLVFDKKGKYLGPLDSTSGLTTWDVSYMSYDTQSKRIYTYCKDGYREYDYEGNLKQFFKGENIIAVYDNLVWYQANETKAGKSEVRLLKSTKDNSDTVTLKRFQFTLPQLYLNANVLMYPNIWVEKNGKIIYIASPTLNKIFEYHNGLLELKWQIIFKNTTTLTFADTIKTSFGFIDDAILINYFRGRTSYDYIFSPQTEKHFNIQYQWNRQGKLTSGLNDDILQTGLFKIRLSQGVPYFIKQTAELKGSTIYSKQQVNPIVFFFSLD